LTLRRSVGFNLRVPPSLDLRSFIRDVPDFPRAGVLFRDITPLLGNAEALRQAVDWYCETVEAMRPEAVVGIESRGFLFGTPVAARLGLPFVPVRKPGKLPAQRMTVEYSLEYGDNQLDIHADALRPGQTAVVVDDLIATGGTASGAAKLVEFVGGKVAAFVFLIELADLGGRERLTSRVESLIRYE
jgi:adenine phosphoribosyltransferase